MDTQKAIEYFSGKLERTLSNRRRQAYETALEALEKQLSKEPIYDGDGYAPDGTFVWDEWLCPNCGKRYEVDYDNYSFCPDCGQKIKWEE